MQCNVGKTDRLLKNLHSKQSLSAGFYFQSWWGAIGIVPLMTGALRWCPPYSLLGINTDKK